MLLRFIQIGQREILLFLFFGKVIVVVEMSGEQAQSMAAYQKVSKIFKEIVDTLTMKELGHIKNYLNNLGKRIAAKENEILAECLDVKSLLESLKDGKNKSPVHFAAAKGDVEIIRHLIENYKVDHQMKDKEGNTLYFTAVEHGNYQLMKYFIEELNVSPHSTKDGEISAMHLAANNNHVEILQYLFSKGCDIEKISIYGKPINWAVGSRNYEATKFLLDHGADANGDTTCPAPPPIILAIDFGAQDIYEALLNAPKPANIKAKDPQGYTPLHVAAQKGSLKIVKQLIERGCEANDQVEGKSALYLAFENEKWEVVSYLKGLSKDHEEIEKKVKEAQKKVEEEKEVHPVDKKKAEEIKMEGNKLYAEKKYEEALNKYEEALLHDHENDILHRNMAACYLPLQKYQQALQHTHRAKLANPKNVKTLYREAQAYIGLQNFMQASTSLWQCAMLQPQTPFFRVQFKKYFDLAKQKHQEQKK